MPRFPVRWAVVSTAALGFVIVAGAAVDWPLYPWSDLITLGCGLLGGVLLGRQYPLSIRSFLILLITLSGLDIAQNVLFSGPPPGTSAPAAAPNPHFIWLNFRISLPSGHVNIGLADLVVIGAMTAHLKRNQVPIPWPLLPGVVGLLLAD